MGFPRRAHLKREGGPNPKDMRGSIPERVPPRENTLILTFQIFYSNPE